MSISQISVAEMIFIKGHFTDLNYVRCENSVDKMVQAGYDYDIALKTIQEKNKCKTVSKDAVQQIDNLKFYTCTCNYRYPLMSWLIQCVDGWEKGILPYNGSLSDQPAKIMDAIYLLQRLKIDYNIYEQNKKELAEA